IVHAATCHQAVEQRGIALATLGRDPLASPRVDCPAAELVLEQPRLAQIGGLLELELPGITGLAVNAVDNGAAAHDLMTQTTIDIKNVLVEGIDTVFPRLQVQGLVLSPEQRIGRRYGLSID